jgi:hypothetical protein
MEGEKVRKVRHSSNYLCHGHLDLGPGMLGVENQYFHFNYQLVEMRCLMLTNSGFIIRSISVAAELALVPRILEK